MKFTSNSFMYKLMLWHTKKDNFPTNLCSLFWTLVWIAIYHILLFPFGWVYKWIDIKSTYSFQSRASNIELFILNMVSYVFLILVGIIGAPVLDVTSLWDWRFLLAILIGAGMVIVVIGSAFLLVYVIIHFKSIVSFGFSKKRVKLISPSAATAIKEYFKARKEKVCPLIEFEDIEVETEY